MGSSTRLVRRLAADRGKLETAEKAKQVVKQGLSEYFLFTIEGREDIKDKEPKRLVALKVADVPLESIYKLSDRTARPGLHEVLPLQERQAAGREGQGEEALGMENLGLSPLPNGTVRLFSEYKNKDLAYVGGTETKYVPIGDRVEVNVGPDKDITIRRRLKDQKTANVVARQYKRRLDDDFVLYYDLIDYDETFFYEEELVSGKPVPAKIEVERQFDADVVLWGSEGSSRRAGRATSRGPTSICTRSPAAWSGSTSSTSSISWICRRGRSRRSSTA